MDPTCQSLTFFFFSNPYLLPQTDLLVPKYRRTMNARTEKRADEESKKFDEKQNDLPSKLAEGITTELRSYPKRIITQFQLKL